MKIRVVHISVYTLSSFSPALHDFGARAGYRCRPDFVAHFSSIAEDEMSDEKNLATVVCGLAVVGKPKERAASFTPRSQHFVMQVGVGVDPRLAGRTVDDVLPVEE